MRKTRAERDAERLFELQATQDRIDGGELSVEDAAAAVEGDDSSDSGAAARELAYQEIEDRMAEREAMAGTGDPVVPTAADTQTKQIIDPSEIADLKRRLSFYEQELNPAQRRAQQLEREVEDLRSQLAARPVAPEGPADYGLTDEEKEFETVTSIAEKVNKTNNAKLLKVVEDLRSKLEGLEELDTRNKVNAKIATHRSEVGRFLNADNPENPDVYFAHPKMPEWLTKQADEEQLALRNPLAYSSKFVAGLLIRFKSEALRGSVKREPSHGDSGVPSRVAPDVIVPGDSPTTGPRFNPRTFQADVNKLISERRIDEANALITAGERAMRN